MPCFEGVVFGGASLLGPWMLYRRFGRLDSPEHWAVAKEIRVPLVEEQDELCQRAEKERTHAVELAAKMQERMKYLQTCSSRGIAVDKGSGCALEALPTKKHLCKHGYAQRHCPNCFNVCSSCNRKIYGVICVNIERCLHFGCCPEERWDIALRPSMDELRLAEDVIWKVVDMPLEALERSNQGDILKSNQSHGDLVTYFMKCQTESYPFRLRIRRAFSLTNAMLEKNFKQVLMRLSSSTPNVKRLFHGTSIAAVKSITSDGFKLPQVQGMFGRGVYFAGTPQKAWGYCRRTPCYMLVCDVALGATWEKREADPSCNGRSETTSFDSVTGLARPLGTLMAAEYIIYNISQALPVYLLEVEVEEA